MYLHTVITTKLFITSEQVWGVHVNHISSVHTVHIRTLPLLEQLVTFHLWSKMGFHFALAQCVKQVWFKNVCMLVGLQALVKGRLLGHNAM